MENESSRKSREEGKDIFQLAVEASGIGIVMLDADSLEMIYANPKAVWFSLSDNTDYSGCKCYQYMAKEQNQCADCDIDRVRKYGVACRFRVIRSPGTCYSVELKKGNWQGKDVIISYIKDVTEIMQERHQSEQLLRQAIENANLLSWEYSFTQERLVNENRILREAGYVNNPGHLPETQIADGYVAPESMEEYRLLFEKMRKGAATVSGQIWFYRNKDKNDKHCLSLSYTANRSNDGKLVSASGLGLDITDKKMTQILHQKQIETMMHSYPDALGSLLMNLSKDYVTNQKRLHSFIQERKDMKIAAYLKGMEAQLNKEDYKKYTQIFSRQSLIDSYHSGRQQVSLTHQYHFMDKTRWIHTTARILPNPMTNELEAYVFAVDVTEKVLSEQVIQKLINMRYDILALIYPREGYVDFRHAGNEFENLPQISIVEYDKNRYNSSKLFDREQALDYIRFTEMDVIRYHLDKMGSYSFTMSRIIDGRKRYKRYSYNYLTGNHEIILSTVQDITEIYEKEEAQIQTIQTALAEAERANAAKTAFLSNMSHDIRTPMNAIINMTKMAKEDIHVPQKALDDLHKVETSSEFLLSLINDVLDMAKIDSGKMEFHPSVYGHEEFMGYIDSIFLPLCRKKSITFLRNREKTALSFYVDVLRLNQIFFNVLSNAVKYTPTGGRILYEERNVQITQKQFVCDFVICDNGQGMSEEFQKKMFQPFEREEDRTPKQSGTGLGLAIVKNTVDRLKGVIHVESAVGKGTTFTIRMALPIATEEQKKERESAVRKSDHIDLDGKRILVAEDHPINRDIMKRLLERRGVSVEMAEDGEKCLRAFVSHEAGYYDAILMDVRMPVMDGLSATRKIREFQRTDARVIPIIAMTANAFSEDKRIAKEAGMTAYLAKPVDAQEVYLTLASLL